MDKIKLCTPAEQRGKAPHAEIEFSAGNPPQAIRLPLTDTMLHAYLPSENLAQVCKTEGKSGYYFTAKTLQVLRPQFGLGEFPRLQAITSVSFCCDKRV